VRISPDLAWQVIDGEGVVVDLPRRRLLGLSPSASFIWSRIGTASEQEIAADLARAFDVEETRALADVHAFLARLSAMGLVTA
jgi:hypothetical protein